MARTPIDFVFRCQRDFADLPGDDPIVRRCPDCDTNVTDLDLLADGELDEFLLHADLAGMELCARATVTGIQGCGQRLKPGTYTGRTVAGWRRAGRVGNPRDGESVNEMIQRVIREAEDHERQVTALLDRVRARQPVPDDDG